MRRPLPLLLIVCLVAAAVLFAGCSKQSTAPPASGGGNGASAPAIIATLPAARSLSAAYDSEIWAQFDRPLDSRTVTTQTAYLKLDGQRLAIDVSYDGITRRVFLRPRVTLALQRTYTAEFSPSIKGLDGTPLPEGVFFQFTTNSLRRVTYDFPVEDALEGRVTALGWAGTIGAQSNIFHEVYASEDSAAVVQRTAPILQRTVFTRFVAASVWRPGSRVWWAVTSENLVTRERENGPLRSFRVLDDAVLIDSLVVRLQDFGGGTVQNRNTQFCASQLLPCGPSFNGALHWNFGVLPANARIVDVRMRLWFSDGSSGLFPTTLPAVWLAQNDWSACAVGAPGPPFNETSGLLASAYTVDASEMGFQSTRLAAFAEAAMRRRTFVYGTLIRMQANANVHSPNSNDQAKVPLMVVRFQRLPTGAAN